MSIVHWMIVIGVVVLLFGRHKISDLMGDVAHGIKSFKKGIQEDEPIASPTDDTPPGSKSMLAAPVSAPIGEKVWRQTGGTST